MANEEKREKATGIKRHPDPEKDAQQVPMEDPYKNPSHGPNSEPSKRVR